MFPKRRLIGSGTSEGNLDQTRSKKQKVAEGLMVFLDVAKESAYLLPGLGPAIGGVNEVVKLYEQIEGVKEKIRDLDARLTRFKRNIATAPIDGDPGETERRKELTSALKGIEKRLQALQSKGVAARFVDKDKDSNAVVKLIERLQEAITNYHISQRQAIYDQITGLTSPFDTRLKLHERSPPMKDKLDSLATRLERSCSEDSDNALQGDNEGRVNEMDKAGPSGPPPTTRSLQRVIPTSMHILDYLKESTDIFSPLKPPHGWVNAFIKHYEPIEDVKEKIRDLDARLTRFKRNIATALIDGDPGETERRKELTSALKGIEKRLQALQSKGVAARFVDKDKDSNAVVKLIERLQEAITNYQVSQQQAIYDQITGLTSSFDTLLSFHERSPPMNDKLDSLMARLERLCLEDSDDALQGDNEGRVNEMDGAGPSRPPPTTHRRSQKIRDLEARLTRFKQNIATTTIDGDPGETERRKELTSALEEIEERSQALPSKGVAAWFVDKGVVKLIERLQEEITNYQISQQQAIYDQINGLVQLERLCSEDSDNALQDDSEERVSEMDKRLEDRMMPDQKRIKLLNELCKTCSRHRVIPTSMRIPDCSEGSEEVECGGFANISQGTYEGRLVAIKVVCMYITSDLDAIYGRFCREAVAWKHLRHPNILPLLGVTVGEHRFAMVSEWMKNGNINEFIEREWHANRAELLVDVANGLRYMHGLRIVHGDLKGANILINEDRRACIADFGLSTITGVATYAATRASRTSLVSIDTLMSFTGGGTRRWMSPELLDPERFVMPESEDNRPTRQSDCYALGMVIYEVLCGHHPYLEIPSDIMAVNAIMEGVRPRKPQDAKQLGFSDELWSIVEQCWLEDRDARPEVESILSYLNDAATFWYMREF